MPKILSSYSGITKECWQSAFLTLVEATATGIIFFLSLYFVSVIHLSVGTAGLLISSYAVGTVLGGILSGKLTDHFSAKLISTFSLLAQALAFLLLTYLEKPSLLMINMFIVGYCCYSFMTANNIWLLKQSGHDASLRLKGINMTRAASNLGLGIAGIIIGSVSVAQFKVLFVYSSVTLLASAFYFYYMVNDTENTKSVIKPSTNSTTHSRMSSNKSLMVVMLNCTFFISLIIAQLSVTYPIYIQQLFSSMGTSAISILFILDTFLIVIFQVPLINNIKRFNAITSVGVGALLMGLGMYILNFSTFFSVAIISCIVWTTGEIIFFGMSQFICYEAGEEKKKGQTLGIYQAIYASGRILGASLGGYIFDIFGSRTLWEICMLIGLYCFLICLYFRKDNLQALIRTQPLANVPSQAN